jgi:hypothetical protein
MATCVYCGRNNARSWTSAGGSAHKKCIDRANGQAASAAIGKFLVWVLGACGVLFMGCVVCVAANTKSAKKEPAKNAAVAPSAASKPGTLVDPKTLPDAKPTWKAQAAAKPAPATPAAAPAGGGQKQQPATPSGGGRAKCCDGTLSPSCGCGGGRGCCSRHGGVCGCG